VIARGTDGPDAIKVDATGVTGVGARTSIIGADATGDTLTAATLGDADTITSGVGIPGTAIMTIDGGDGADTTRYSGTAGDDLLPVVSNGPAAAIAPPGNAIVQTVAVEDLIVLAGAGADQMFGTGNLAALTRLTYDGGAGDDIVNGGNGADTLIGGSGDDSVDGQQGNDTAFLGSGADRFQWDPGDGNDTVEGQGGVDALAFNGSAIGELLEVSANGERVRFTRNIANIVMDLNDVEQLGLRALGGNDTVTVNDTAGTDADGVNVDLSGSAGGGDLAQDVVIVNGTDAADKVKVNRVEDSVVTAGLAAQTSIAGSELLNDTLRINTLAGDDTVTVDPNAELLITPVIDLGADG
jgi:Ca2+-binding RTX toxin-like protein